MQLRGMTWAHSRGYTSLVAVSQRYEELHPDVKITWDKRSLQAFADQPVGELAKQYDLLVIDHPWSGFGAAAGVLVPMEDLLPENFLRGLRTNSVGESYDSYQIEGRQMALPIDAAAPIAVYRPDLMGSVGGCLPSRWEDVLSLAGRGAVLFAAKPLYTVTDFYMFCAALTVKMFTETEVVERTAGIAALETLRELACRCDPIVFDLDPIQVCEAMSSGGSQYAYCPFTFGYSNYARAGYNAHVLKAHNLVTYRGRQLRSILGGTGLAVSSGCSHMALAADFAAYAAQENVQKTIYFDAGGQPGHRSAWTDAEVNRRSNDFFRDSLLTLDAAIVRPRYNGYLLFQDRAGPYIAEYMQKGGRPGAVIDQLDLLYQKSRNEEA